MLNSTTVPIDYAVRFVQSYLALDPSFSEISETASQLESRSYEIEINCDVLHHWTGCPKSYIDGELARAADMRRAADELRLHIMEALVHLLPPDLEWTPLNDTEAARLTLLPLVS